VPWNFPLFRTTEPNASESLVDLGNGKFLGQGTDSILLSRAGKSRNHEHGSVTVTLRSETKGALPRSLRVGYGPKDSPKAILKKLARQFNRSRDVAVKATVHRSESGAILEFVGRRTQGPGLVLSVSVHADVALPSLRATVQTKNSHLPLLTGITGAGE
jgi:hypothetical protein